MQSTLKKLFLVISLSLLVASQPAVVFAHAGKVLFTSGKVTAIDKKGKERALKRGADIHAGDTIVTGPKSRTQLRTGDGSTVALQAKSRFVIENHVHTGPPDKQNSAVELLNGGMRAVTGAIGKRNPENFKIKAGTLTIGIRGTEIVVQLCDDDCEEVAAKKGDKKQAPKNGVYVGVLNGAITVGTEESTEDEVVELDAGLKVVLGEIMGIDETKRQYAFFSETKDAKPEALEEPPPVLLQALSPPSPEEIDIADDVAPVSTLDRYEGISAEQLQQYLVSNAPRESRRAIMAAFDQRESQGEIDPLIKHRDIYTPYFGRDASGLYDLTSGQMIYIGP